MTTVSKKHSEISFSIELENEQILQNSNSNQDKYFTEAILVTKKKTYKLEQAFKDMDDKESIDVLGRRKKFKN